MYVYMICNYVMGYKMKSTIQTNFRFMFIIFAFIWDVKKANADVASIEVLAQVSV